MTSKIVDIVGKPLTSGAIAFVASKFLLPGARPISLLGRSFSAPMGLALTTAGGDVSMNLIAKYLLKRRKSDLWGPIGAAGLSGGMLYLSGNKDFLMPMAISGGACVGGTYLYDLVIDDMVESVLDGSVDEDD